MSEYSITVVQEVNRVVVQQTNNTVSVAAAGPQGPPGPQGPAGAPGGASYQFTQSVPSSTWVINHNLNRKVHVSLFDDDGNQILSDIEHGSLNQATVTWSSPTTGTAHLS